MRSANLESLAVTSVKQQLARIDCVEQTYISEGDREPVWDGRIHILGLDGDNSRQLVNVQVKGKSVESDACAKEVINHSGVGVSDLQNYMNNGGVVYFMVYITDSESQVYYNCLAPIKIYAQLLKVKQQKSCTIQMRRLPDDPLRVAEILINFARDSHRQASFSTKNPLLIDNLSSPLIDNLQFTFTGFGHTPDEVLMHLVGHETYTYAQLNNLPFLIPTEDYGTITLMSQSISSAVIVDGVEYYASVEKVITEDSISIRFGHFIELVTSREADATNSTLRVTPTGTLSERITDMHFLAALCKTESLEIGRANISLPNIAMGIEKEIDPSWQLALFEDLKGLLNYFSVNEDLEIDSISNEDVENIFNLGNSLLRNEPQKNIDYPYSKTIIRWHLLSYTVLLFAERLPDGSYQIDDFCRKNEYCIYGDDAGEWVPTSRFMMLEPVDYALVINLDFDAVVESVVSVEPTLGHCRTSTNIALNLLAAFDISSRSDCLFAALKVFKWLLEVETGIADRQRNTINALQTTIRYRELTGHENQTLDALLSEDSELAPEDRSVSFAVLVLLNKTRDAQKVFDQLSEEKKKQIVGYPIETLWLKLLDKECGTQ